MKLDPDHKECHPLYKKIKKVAKALDDAQNAQETSSYDNCIESANKVLKWEPSIENVKFHAYQRLCKCYGASSESTLAIKNCLLALKIQKDPDTLCDSAEAYLDAEMYDDG